MFLSYITLLILTIGLLVPILVFFAECGLAVLKPLENKNNQEKTKQWGKDSLSQPKIAILIPAHNEAPVIADTLAGLLPQLTSKDKILVIADNCTDHTAEIAIQMGVQVVERQDQNRRGKGYALDYGMQYLKADPPEVVIILDADCTTSPNAIPQIGSLAKQTHRPVQATYLMEQTSNPTPKETISRLALLIKNLVRPLGLASIGLPCLLTGSGMGFPWSVLSEVSLAGNKTADDMQLSVDLAIAGYSPIYCPEAKIIGRLMEKQAAISQRKRWEHGHLDVIFNQSFVLFKEAIAQRRLDLLALALEICVPPLSLLMLFWLTITVVGLLIALIEGVWIPLSILGTQGALIVIAVFLAWLKFGRHDISGKNFLAIPLYIVWKIPIYFGFIVKPQTQWLTTERDEPTL